MGAPLATRTGGIPRQGPVELRRRRRSSIEASAAAVALLSAVLLALVLQPDPTSVAIGMVALGTVLMLAIPPARDLLGHRDSASLRRR